MRMFSYKRVAFKSDSADMDFDRVHEQKERENTGSKCRKISRLVCIRPGLICTAYVGKNAKFHEVCEWIAANYRRS